MRKLSTAQQDEVLLHVRETFDAYRDQLSTWKQRMQKVYENVSTFEERPKAKWQTTFKVNKAFEAENKVLPRVVANYPKRLVSLMTDEFDEEDKNLPPEQRAEKLKKVRMYADAIRDYLMHVFSKQDLKTVTKLRVKNAIRYGMGRAKICYRYNLDADAYTAEETDYDEEGNEIITMRKQTKQKVVGEYPSIDLVSWSDIYFDPRYIRLDDMPAVIEVKENVRLSYFTKNPKKYMNVDQLVDVCNIEFDDADGYKQKIYAVTGVTPAVTGKVDKNRLSVKKYYGWFDFKSDDGSEEKLYEFWTVNDMLVVYAEEIVHIPFEAIRCFEDTETFLATGFVEPMLGLQDELNFKKNTASQAMNQALNRTFVWSPNSGINPKHLHSAPGNIIPTTKDGQTAIANLVELPYRQLPANYWQEQNDFERQIQGITFTIDTTTPQGNQALTNTATGIKVKVFESNSVVNMIRENYEQALVNIAYKFLQATFENLDDNLSIKNMGDESFWEVNKEAMRDAVRRYAIRVEAGSTSYDSVEQRRADKIAQWNMGTQAKQFGVPVNMTKLFKETMGTFEGVDPDELIEAMPMPGMPGQGMPGTSGQNANLLPMPQATQNMGEIPLQ